MTFDVEFQMNPMTLDVDMGTVYDVTGDEYERGYAAGEQAGYAAGRQEGYSEGEAAGYESGKSEGQAVTDLLLGKRFNGDYANDTVTSLGTYAFSEASGLTGTSFANLLTIGNYAFQSATHLSWLNVPKVETIGTRVFVNTPALTRLDLPRCASIGSACFHGSAKIAKLILRRTDVVCTLGSADAFGSSPIANGTGYVYVPDELVDSYKAAANWSTYAAQIRPLSELET